MGLLYEPFFNLKTTSNLVLSQKQVFWIDGE